MKFEFYPLRFQFRAVDSLYFPPGKAGNILRGALGVVFRQIACVPECSDSRRCERRESCAYARVFEPVRHGSGPSGLSDLPRPFVFRARHLEGRTVQPGESFHFDLHVFSLDPAVFSNFVLTFSAIACQGLGPRRGKSELQCVRRLAFGDVTEQILHLTDPLQPVSLDLQPASFAPSQIRVEFLSPTELKQDHKVIHRPEFPILFARIRDRISTLRALYGPGPLAIDFKDMGERARAIRMTRCSVRRREAVRSSSRTSQTHSIGGFIGSADYEGDFAEFLPYLEAAQWTGVGRHASWGNGEIAVLNRPALPS